MGRLNNTFLEGQGPNAFTTSPMVDPSRGNTFGFMPDYAGFVSSAIYVRKNLLAIVLETPRGLRDMPNSEAWVRISKAFFETASYRIDGLQATLEAEMVSTPWGIAGEQLESVGKVTRQQSSPQHTLDERYGRPFQNWAEGILTNLHQDPDTGWPRVIHNTGAQPNDFLPDYNTFTVLYLEPDPTFRFVDKAFLCFNMIPKTGGVHEARKDATAGGEKQELTIGFTAITQHGYGVKQLATKILRRMSLNNINPYYRKAALDDLSADVRAANTVGYMADLARATTEQITPTAPT